MGQMLSYPPHLRQTFSGYLLLGVLPPKVQSYNTLYGGILKHIRSTGAPVDEPIHEYSTKVFPLCSFKAVDHAEQPPTQVTKHLVINTIVEDTSKPQLSTVRVAIVMYVAYTTKTSAQQPTLAQ
jgi:hypothetical protein